MADAFTFALREHMQLHGEIPGHYGSTGLSWHRRQNPECTGWVIPEGAKAVPDYSYEFAGTDADMATKRVIRLDTRVSCSCGEHSNRTIQVEGTFSELLTQLLAIEVPREVQF